MYSLIKKLFNSILLSIFLLLFVTLMLIKVVYGYHQMQENQIQLAILQLDQQEKEAKAEQIAFKSKELECLAKNIYYEARGESFEGKKAVAQVTLNRVNNKEYPNTICQVVYQKTLSSTGNVVYQFSWVGKNHTNEKIDPYLWDEAHYIAKKALTDKVAHATIASNNVLWYHSDYVHPKWKLVEFTRIGHHIFYVKV